MPYIRQHLHAGAVVRITLRMADEPYSELVGRAFHSQCDHFGGICGRYFDLRREAELTLRGLRYQQGWRSSCRSWGEWGCQISISARAFRGNLNLKIPWISLTLLTSYLHSFLQQQNENMIRKFKKLTGLQRDVLSLYRACLRQVRSKPTVCSPPLLCYMNNC